MPEHMWPGIIVVVFELVQVPFIYRGYVIQKFQFLSLNKSFNLTILLCVQGEFSEVAGWE